MTGPTLKVLGTLLGADTELSGAAIADTTKLASGMLYPILIRLEGIYWIESQWETPAPQTLGRPCRRFYRMTALGKKKARAAFKDLQPALDKLAGGIAPGRVATEKAQMKTGLAITLCESSLSSDRALKAAVAIVNEARVAPHWRNVLRSAVADAIEADLRNPSTWTGIPDPTWRLNMTTTARVCRGHSGYLVEIQWGGSGTETRGPYHWRWQARLVAWLNNDIH
jgi:DNA-binding PadR family transcriptional regulator